MTLQENYNIRILNDVTHNLKLEKNNKRKIISMINNINFIEQDDISPNFIWDTSRFFFASEKL